MSIKDVPMVTADEMPIVLDMVLYSFEYNGGYSFNREGSYEVEAHRVVSLDNSRRFFRTRCIAGCESENSLSSKIGACPSQRFYGSLSHLKKALCERISADQKKCDDKVKQVQETKNYLAGLKVKVADITSVKTPRSIGV